MKIIFLLCCFSFSLAIDGNGAGKAMDNSKKSIEVLLDANVGLIAKRMRKCVIKPIDSSRTGNMTKDAMGDRIANFCQGYSLIFKKNKKNLKREALELLRDRSKRDVTIRDFVVCNNANINVIQYCPSYRLAVLCKFRPGAGCQDVVLCNKFDLNGSNCKGVHAGCRLNCCDFVCLPC